MNRLVKCILLSVTILGFACGSSPSDSDTTPPDPSNLTFTTDFSLVQLSWDQCTSDDFAEYRLYRSTAPDIQQSPGTPLASFTSVTDLSYNDAAVDQDETYYYAIQTLDDNDLSAWSNEVTVETPVIAVDGYWEGLTDQGKTISFYVTTDQTIGEMTLTIDISWAPDIDWYFSGYGEYDTEGNWSASGEGSFGGGYHTILVNGTFTASNLCVGNLVATSEDYYGGYYVESDFEVYPGN